MSWQILQTRRFARAYKKLKPNIVADVDAAVAEISVSPEVGELPRYWKEIPMGWFSCAGTARIE